MFESVGITCRREVEDTKLFQDVIQFLVDSGRKVALSTHARENLGEAFKDLPEINYSKKFDLLIAFGGDGTILRAARNLKHYDTIILGINAGQLGFLATIGKKNWKKELMEILEGKHLKVYKSVCNVILERKGKKMFEKIVLNDAVVSYKNVSRLITVDAKVDGIDLCTYKADGLIVATPTGSTAYNLAAGGPIVYPSIRAMIITPICSHSFTQKPIVIPGEKSISLEFTSNDEVLNLTLDGQQSFDINRDDKITINIKNERLTFLKKDGDNFFKTLREKLHWGETLR